MADATLDKHRDGLVHLVAHDAARYGPRTLFSRHRLFTRLFVYYRLDPRDLALVFFQQMGLCQLPGRLLHAQLELFLAQREQLLPSSSAFLLRNSLAFITSPTF
jgi:hypothetical protein